MQKENFTATSIENRILTAKQLRELKETNPSAFEEYLKNSDTALGDAIGVICEEIGDDVPQKVPKQLQKKVFEQDEQELEDDYFER